MSVGGPSSNVGVSTAPSRRPAKSGWGPNPARPKPGGEEWGNGAATGGPRARPSAVESRAPSWVASIRPPVRSHASRRGSSSAAPRIQSTSLCSSGTSARRPYWRTPWLGRAPSHRWTSSSSCSRAAGPSAEATSASRRTVAAPFPAGPAYDSVRSCWRISTFSRRVPGVCSRNVQRTTPFPSISTYARFEKNLSSSSVP